MTVGLAVAFGILRVAPLLAPGDVPGLDETGIDLGVLAFAAGLSLAAGLLFGAGRPPPRDPRDVRMASIRTVSPGYAEALRLRLRAGRFFTDRDTAGSPRVAVVSESFAREAFRGEPAVGQRLVPPAFSFPGGGPGGGGPGGGEAWEVVGVVADVASPFMPAGMPAASEIYLSMLQPGMSRMPAFDVPTVAVRAGENPLAVVPFLREVLAEVEPGMPVSTMALETLLSARAAQPRFYAACAGVFGMAALALAAFGLYAVLGYAVSRRRREIGIAWRSGRNAATCCCSSSGRAARSSRPACFWVCWPPPPASASSKAPCSASRRPIR